MRVCSKIKPGFVVLIKKVIRNLFLNVIRKLRFPITSKHSALNKQFFLKQNLRNHMDFVDFTKRLTYNEIMKMTF